jgi:hypothetical protein
MYPYRTPHDYHRFYRNYHHYNCRCNPYFFPLQYYQQYQPQPIQPQPQPQKPPPVHITDNIKLVTTPEGYSIQITPTPQNRIKKDILEGMKRNLQQKNINNPKLIQIIEKLNSS